MPPDFTESGYIKVESQSIYYEVYGDLATNKTPLLVLHGGPGSSHNYLLPLAKLSSYFPVIFYDQLGSGRSQVPTSDSLYSINYFVHELDQVRKHLELKKAYLLGHSWGGMLLIEYLGQKKNTWIKSVILASSMIDSSLYNKEAIELVRKINKKYPKLVKAHLEAGTYNSEELENIYKLYKKQYLFRKNQRSGHYSSLNPNNHLYNKMWGPTEMYITGSLKTWSGLKILPTIKQQTLVISGEFDELTPEQNHKTAQLIANATSVIVPNSSHLAHLEQTAKYVKAIKTFLDK